LPFSEALRNLSDKEDLTVCRLIEDNSDFFAINQELSAPPSLPYQWLVLTDQLTTSARG